MPAEKISVIGGGSWGTTLALLLAEQGQTVTLWLYEKDLVEDILKRRENTRYLPGIPLPATIRPTASLAEAVTSCTLMVFVVPSHVARKVLQQAVSHLRADLRLVCATKGIETDTLMLMSEMIKEVAPAALHARLAVLTGPSFAREVCQKHPTAVVLAAEDPDLARSLAGFFGRDYFRVFTSQDIIGVQLGGAIKNVIALASGGVDGLGLGHNTRCALIARGLAEITRLGTAMGADPKTFTGLSGLGDLVLTCTGGMSRNRTVGFKLGQGMKLSEILKEMQSVAEGVQTTRAAYTLAKKMNIRMPIVEQMHAVLFEDKELARALPEMLEGANGPE